MLRNTSTSSRLAKDQHLVWQASRSATLEVLQGRVWVTATNRLDDHFIDAGQRLTLPPHARAVIGAECLAALRIELQPSPLALALARLLAHLPRRRGQPVRSF